MKKKYWRQGFYCGIILLYVSVFWGIPLLSIDYFNEVLVLHITGIISSTVTGVLLLVCTYVLKKGWGSSG